MKERTGQVFENKKNGLWTARVCYKNTNGKRTAIQRTADNKTDARKLLKQLLEKLESGGRKVLDVQKLTISDLVDYYEEIYCKPAHYVNDRKVAGLRSFVGVKGYLKVFRQYFGELKLNSLTYDDIHSFRLERLTTPTHQSSQRAIATVNRELAYLRRLLNIAERNDWIIKNPFKRGDSLIHLADEVKRERVLTPEECQRLIDACEERRSHLKPIIIAALDLGCRLGELLKLQWKDVDLDSKIITIQAFNTKTMRERKVGITQRLHIQLDNLLFAFPHSENDLVFGVSEIRKGFKSACKIAGLSDLRFHDLRHVHATKLDSLGFSISAIGKQLGHSSDSRVTLRYINRNEEATRQVANALDEFYESVNIQTELANGSIN
jgi:integrase